MNNLRTGIVFTIVLLGMGAISVHAQTNPKLTTCEYGSARLDYILDNISERDIVIVVARLGRNEKNLDLNRRRLFNVKHYLTNYRGHKFFVKDPKNLVLVTGDRTEGLGTLEFYFRGELFDTYLLPANKDVYLGECAVDLEFYKTPCNIPEQKGFYPCLDSVKKKLR